MAKPEMHFIPTQHWMNDPNGFIYYHGLYHLFYQYFPYENAWGTMHWGHKTSPDLIHWEDHGIALYPSKPFDQNGVFSGSAITLDDQLAIYYTAVVYDEIQGDDIHRQTKDGFHACQAMIISPDGFHFDNKQKTVVVPCFETNTQQGHRIHTRDPKVWQENHRYYMVLGCKYTKPEAMKTTGEILIYQSMDGLHWQFASTMEDDRIGTMWECPDYFEVDHQGILTISPEHFYEKGGHYTNVAVYMPVSFHPETATMEIQQDCQLLDLGEDLYATQSTLDETGMRTLIGWMRMPEPEMDGQWIGMMSYPRVLHVQDGHLWQQPHPHIAAQFTQPCGDFHAKQARKIIVDMAIGSTLDLGGYLLQFKADQCLHVDRSKVFVANSSAATTFQTPPLQSCHLEIYTDLHIVEIFINQGQYVLSNIVYDMKNDIKFENIPQFDMFKPMP